MTPRSTRSRAGSSSTRPISCPKTARKPSRAISCAGCAGRGPGTRSRRSAPRAAASCPPTSMLSSSRTRTGTRMATSPIAGAKTLIIKVGSSLVTNEGRGLDESAIARWAAQIAELRKLGRQCVLVSSGAIAEGLQRLGWAKRPKAIHELQAAAAVGQMGLAQCYESCFRAHGLATAQVLLTHADMADRERYLNARSTLRTLRGLW